MPPGEGRGAAGWPPSRPGGASSEHPRVLGREAVERLVFSEITVILKTSCFSAGPLSRSLPPEAAVLTVSDICCPLRGVHSFLLTEWAEIHLSSDTEENPRLVLVALYCTVNFLTIIKDLRTKKKSKAGRRAMLRQSLDKYSKMHVSLVTCLDLTSLRSVNLLAGPHSGTVNAPNAVSVDM
ncbi:uncharacterized protein FN964_011786 isoform 1-T1 [Alca torda]